MRWKKLVCGALLLAVLLAPATAMAAPRPSPWSAGVVDWLETLWSQLLGVAASGVPLDADTDEADLEAGPTTATASEPDGEAAPAADGGPEWDPDGQAAEGGPEWDPNGNS